MAESRGLEDVGKTARKKRDPRQDREINVQTHKDNDLFVRLRGNRKLLQSDVGLLKVENEVKKTYMIKRVKQPKGPRSRSTGIGGLFLWGHHVPLIH